MGKAEMMNRHDLKEPVLQALRAHGGTAKAADIVAYIVDTMQLSASTAEIGWARTYLKGEGRVENPSWGVWTLTEKEKNTTQTEPKRRGRPPKADKLLSHRTEEKADKRLTKDVEMKSEEKQKPKSRKIFIVHGRDHGLKYEVDGVLKKLGFEPIILHEQASAGKTIIEKIEEFSEVGFGIVLYTPCDEGNIKGEQPKPRARQNVVFEHGYLMGKLGRENVLALVAEGVEKPNDLSGIVYVEYVPEAWRVSVCKELKRAGYEDVDLNKLY